MLQSRRGLVAVMFAAVLTACGGQESEPAQQVQVESATFSQQQAVPDFDDAVYLVTDAAELDRLKALLHEHEVSGDVELRSDCDGSRISTVVWSDEQAAPHWLVVDGCRDDPLSVDVTDLVTEWHERGGWPVATQ